MGFSDDPTMYIPHMIEFEKKRRPDLDCLQYPDGVVIEGLPLEAGERIYGVYKGRFYFTPVAVMWEMRGAILRAPWGQIVSCSSKHGDGHSTSRLVLADGTKLNFPLKDLTLGWEGHISRLYHSMIARWRMPVRDKRMVLDLATFFRVAKSRNCIAPNWVGDRPTLKHMRHLLEEVAAMPDVLALYLPVTEYDGCQPCVQQVLIAAARQPDGVAIDNLKLDWFGTAASRDIEQAGPPPPGTSFFRGVWD